MTIQIKHPFVSAKGDGGDATLVRPSNWNAVHSTSMATGQLIGRLTAGTGAFEEIPLSAYMAGLLGAADQAALAALLGLFETGDVKYTYKATASAGWLLMLGGTGTSPSTIGNAASGASLRANADTLALYTVVYNACSNSLAPVSGGRGASAAADFAANKTISIPNLVGRTPVGAGAATGPTNPTSTIALGTIYGEETNILAVANLPAHWHDVPMYDPGHVHTITHNSNNLTGASGVQIDICFANNGNSASWGSTNAAAAGVRINSVNGFDKTGNAGSGTGHNNIQPSIALNAMVKL